MTAPTVLHTERLLLRPFQDSDVEDARSYRDDPQFARFLPHIPQPFPRRDAEAFVALNRSQPWERSPTFAVVLDSTLIGTVNFEVETDTRTAMVGYAIGRAWWGRGLAAEGARGAMTWAIDRFSLVRIWASTDVRHVRSRRVLEKLWLQREELRVGNHKGRAGELVDEVVYGLKLPPMGHPPNRPRSPVPYATRWRRARGQRGSVPAICGRSIGGTVAQMFGGLRNAEGGGIASHEPPTGRHRLRHRGQYRHALADFASATFVLKNSAQLGVSTA